MKYSFPKKVLLFLLAALACGPDSNLNHLLFVSSQDKEQAETLVQLAQLSYDKGDFDEAQTYAEKAYGLNPQSESSSQILSYVYLAQAGMAPFSLIRTLVAAATGDSDSSSSSSSSSSFGFLDSLASLFKIDASTLALLADLDNLDTDEDTTKYFYDLPVYLPKMPGNHAEAGSVRAEVSSLEMLSKAILVICPFLDADFMAEAYTKYGDDRYKCTANTLGQRAKAQSYLAFAMAHMAEAAIFNLVLLYSGTDSASLRATADSATLDNNLLKRVARLEAASSSANIKITEIASYTQAVIKLKESLDKVFDLTEKSMLSQTIGDLELIAEGFALIPGIPDDVKSSVDSSIEAVKKQADAIKSKVGSNDATTQAFSQKLNGVIAKNLTAATKKYLDALSTKLGGTDELQAKIDADPEVKEGVKTMCSSMNALVEVSDGLTVPDKCSSLSL